MWQILRSLLHAESDFAATASDLLQSTTRTIILCVAGLFAAWHVITTTIWPVELLIETWSVTVVMLLCSLLALYLLRRRALIAQGIWLVGLFAAITIAIYHFQQPQIAYAFVFLPLLAMVMIGWIGGLIAELLILVLASAMAWGVLGTRFHPVEGLAVVLGGSAAGLLGWSATGTLHTAVRWAFAAFGEAERHKVAAQEHRAQLASTVGDLDRAYYRLERSNAALVAARLAAEEAERFKAEFVANVSHELRTPLNLILGFSEVMLTSPESYDGTPLPSAYRSDLNAIGHSAQHLLALVDDVLDMARIGAGRIPLAHDLVDPHVLIDEATATMRDYIATKGLALHVEVQPGLPALWIDRVRIRQVLLNLLVNATRFTDQGSIRVRVHREADELIVAVEDTGRGIPEADLPRIFEAFRSTEQPLSTWHSGTGLGLPISKQFVELHGGRIGVESTSGRGTTFWFTLPAQAVPDPQRRPRRWNPTVHLTTSERIVLVVHDEPAIATLLKRYLEGCRVIHVPGWKAALALAEEVQAIAIVVDTSMDVPDGDSSVPVIRCPLPSGRRAALALGAEDFLVKPVTRATLLAAIDRFETPIHRVLIADDNPKVVRLFRRMLRQHPTIDGVEEAFNGQEALQLMRAEQPDLLLLDLAMPVVDGLDVLEAMAADPDLREIPTIIVSANGYGNDWETTGVLSLWQPTGFQMDDTMRALNALLGTLAPAWRQLESMESGSQAVPAA